MGRGIVTTKAEQEWMGQITRLGCIACRVMGIFGTPCEVHHLLQNGERIDHEHSIGLCPSHHRAGLKNKYVVSRHPWRREFEARYGSEESLLAKTKQLLESDA